MHSSCAWPADSAPVVRAAALGESEQFLDVFCAAFRLDRDAPRPLFYRDPFFDLRLKRVCAIPTNDRDTTIASCLTIIPSVLRIGDAAVPLAGIAGVATRGELRRQGYGGTLLRETLRDASGAFGFPIAGLFPAEPEYYARFGFAYAGRSFEWRAQSHQLPAQGPVGIRLIDAHCAADVDAVSSVYEASMARRAFACVRDWRRWRVVHELMPGRRTFVAEHHGDVRGYAHIELLDAHQSIVVHEMHALDREAARTLACFLRSFQADSITWHSSPIDVAEFGVEAIGETSIQPDVMMRITDLELAMGKAYPANYADVLTRSGKSLSITASDPIRDTPSTVTLDSRGVHPGGGSAHAVAADIGTLTQLYVGYITPVEAVEAGQLTVSGADALDVAQELFPRRDPQIPALDRF